MNREVCEHNVLTDETCSECQKEGIRYIDMIKTLQAENAALKETIESWKKTATDQLLLRERVEADNKRMRGAVQEAINIIGGPNMDYAPHIANQERMEKIKKAVDVLLSVLRGGERDKCTCKFIGVGEGRGLLEVGCPIHDDDLHFKDRP